MTAAAHPAVNRISPATVAALPRTVGLGALAGIGASMVMAAYAMIASATYQHTGFFTPLYHIASLFITPKHMMMSAQAAMHKSSFTFYAGPAVLGAVIHMMTGAMYGAVFAVLASVARLRGMMLVLAGAVWGAAVFVISSFLGLPLAAAILSSGDQITHMAKMVGYPTFLAEHILFGLALGMMLLRLAARRVAR